MNDKLLIGGVDTSIRQYASQGNAILGIRDSGKTYAATMLAEQLLDHGIPFIVFDPIGVWRNLKLPGIGKGYKVVVAHPQNGDLPLTPESAPEIVRAAMRENIPLVLDLYAMNLSKADWKRIVESCIRLMLYENKQHGLRHIFIEEAAEFCPQQVTGDNAKVYAEIEKLARMGGNASLGYTLINQRAEQVNKAVLELCDLLLLFRQKGKNSLTSLGKWLDFANATVSKEVISSLPTLPTGQCWGWLQGTDIPKHITIQRKNSFHPDRQNPVTSTVVKSGANVTDFVETLNGSLEKFIEAAKEQDPAHLKKRIRELENQIGAEPVTKEIIKEVQILKEADIARLEKWCGQITNAVLVVSEAVKLVKRKQTMPMPRAFAHVPQLPLPVFRQASRPDSDGSLGKCDRAILTALAQFPSGRTVSQISMLSGYSLNSSGFTNSLSSLRVKEFITRTHPVTITSAGEKALGEWQSLPTGDALFSFIVSKVGKCERSILVSLQRAGDRGLEKSELAADSGYSENSSGFTNALSYLRTRELITRTHPIKLSEDFFQ